MIAKVGGDGTSWNVLKAEMRTSVAQAQSIAVGMAMWLLTLQKTIQD